MFAPTRAVGRLHLRGGRVLLAVVAMVAFGAAGLAVGHAQAAGATTRHTHVTLAVDGDFPDPGFLKAGSTYYLYATGPHFRVASSTNPNGRFTARGSSMPGLPSWVGKDPGGNLRLWAPHVFAVPDAPGQYKYTMYFSGYSPAHRAACIGVARAVSPLGPFQSLGSSPLVCGPDSSYEAIDPAMFTAGGRRYVIYKLGHNSTSTYSIHALQVDLPTGRSRAPQGINRNLVTARGAIMEAPSIIATGGKIWLFVSRGSYNASCSSYTTQIWTAGSFLGKYSVLRTMPINSPSGTSLCSAGGATVINDAGTYRIAFHAYSGHSTSSGQRRAWTGIVKWDRNGTPYLY